ncbi:ATP-grasp domain-containing protein [Salinactinospora qingdaonensis]|uniref:ATP-grasp domain-containing protein n=1 Tax=Salinactinospora qingdaonensis TaxID=702744 RepID=A0ABP7G8P4_9ACTN
MTRILLLEAAGPESGALARTAACRGISVYAATHPALHTGYPPWLRDLLAGWLAIDFTAPERALENIITFARSNRIDAVLTANEYLTPLVAQACSALGLLSNDPDIAAATRNKVAMSTRFRHYGVDAPLTSVPETTDEAAAFARRSGALPCVVKPAEQAGSQGVTIAYDTDQVVDGYERARRQYRERTYGLPLDTRVLMQPLIVGTEYSVESVTANGCSRHVCITRKCTDATGVETGHDLPAVLPQQTRRRILAETDKALAALGVHNSASHTEVIVEPSGRCRIIEIAARSAAGRIGFLIDYALGIDWWKACIDASLGLHVDVSPTRSRYAAVRFLTSPQHGTLQRLDNLPTTEPDVPELHIRAAFGDPVGPGNGNSGRLGCFITVGTAPAAVSQRADDLLADVRVNLAPERPSSIPGTGAQHA